jgi:hypothetical protein
VAGKKPELGSGERFRQIKTQLSQRKQKRPVRDPGALVAYIGRRKYGTKRFARLGATGRRRRG